MAVEFMRPFILRNTVTKDLFADLHIHTHYSDSTSSPEEVVDEAVKNGLSCIAITDHDVTDGVVPTQEAARGHHLEVIAGIELSSEFEGKDIHMLGYFIDIHQDSLVEKVELFLQERVRRMKQMIVNLQAVGIKDITFEEAAALTKSRAVGRAHLAMLLLQKGHVNSFKNAFEKYLAQGRPGYAPKFKQTPFEAIELIHQSGGLAVKAHPMFAKKNGLLMTGGSDAHGKAKAHTYVGKEAIPYELVEKMKARLITVM